jgi:hypothetical protein
VLFDADLQHTTEEIPRFLAKLDEGWDIVTGRKVGHYEKRAVSSIYNRLSRAIFEIPVSDTNSMKAFRRDILDEVRLRHDWHRFFVVLAYARGFSMTEIDIALHPRRHGAAKYSGKGRIVVGLLDMLSVWFFLFFSRKPMMLFGISGLVMARAACWWVVTIVLRVIGACRRSGSGRCCTWSSCSKSGLPAVRLRLHRGTGGAAAGGAGRAAPPGRARAWLRPDAMTASRCRACWWWSARARRASSWRRVMTRCAPRGGGGRGWR